MKNKFLYIITALSITLYACEGSSTEKLLTNEPIVLSAPVDNLTTTDSIPTFFWEPVDGATLYQLQIVSPRFDSIVKVYTDTTISRNLFPFSLNKGKKYQWRVKAKNNSSATTFSTIRTLTIQ